MTDDDLVRDLGNLGTLLRATSAPIALDELTPATGRDPEALDEMAMDTTAVPPRRPRITLAVAAAVVLAVVAGLVVVTRRPGPSTGDDQATTSSVASVAPGLDTTTTAVLETTAPTVPVDPLTTYRGWFFPTAIPDGFALTRLSATTATSAERLPQRWVRRNADGTLAATVALTVLDGPTASVSRPSATVHGQPADAFDSGEGMVVIWQESGRQLSLRGLDIDLATTLAVAEALQLPADGRAASLPASTGFELLPVAPTVTDAASLEAEWTLATEPLRPAVFRVRPNTDDQTLELLLQRSRLVPGGRASLEPLGTDQVFVGEQPGGLTEVVWIRDGLLFDVAAFLPRGDVLAMAGSVVAVDPHDLQRRGEAIVAAAAALDTFDEATLPDGLHLTVKTEAGARVAFCVDGAVAARCRRQTGTAGFLMAVDMGSRHLVVGWTGLSGELTPLGGDGRTPTTAPAPLDVAAAVVIPSSHGQFFSFDVEPGAPLTSLRVGGETVLGGLVTSRPGELFSY